MNYTIEQEIEMIENLGGTITEDNKYAIFNFPDNVCMNDPWFEKLTLPDAIAIEKQMIYMGYEGALIGHPYDENNPKTIYFRIH